MTLREATIQGEHFVWDDERLDEPRPEYFDAQWWQARDALLAEAQGRGAAYFVAGLDESPWVLRHNRRGGALANVNADRFVYTGVRRARPVREIRLLADLREKGLSVPAPVAARIQPFLGLYQGDLITEQIVNARALADRLAVGSLASTAWQELGGVIARFHSAGVWHADLNARNILIDDGERFHLIDFDKARLRAPGKWREANLARLHRSLEKFRGASMDFHFLDADWAALRGGYTSVFAAGL